MKKRVFIAVNLPERLKKQAKNFREKFDYLPVRWTKEESLHLTLVFIGYASDEQILEICRTLKEVAVETEPFLIKFKKIILGPPNKTPRMIWVEGEANQALGELKNKLEERLLAENIGFGHRETRPLKPHITLARLKADRWRNLETPPQIEENFNFEVPVQSIELMESDLKSDGAEYAIMESVELGNNNFQ